MLQYFSMKNTFLKNWSKNNLRKTLSNIGTSGLLQILCDYNKSYQLGAVVVLAYDQWVNEATSTRRKYKINVKQVQRHCTSEVCVCYCTALYTVARLCYYEVLMYVLNSFRAVKIKESPTRQDGILYCAVQYSIVCYNLLSGGSWASCLACVVLYKIKWRRFRHFDKRCKYIVVKRTVLSMILSPFMHLIL